MRGTIAALAAVAVMASLGGAALAKHHSAKAAQTAQTDQATQPSDQTSSTVPANTDLTGQKIYTSTGNTVGTVASMSKDGQGQSAAVVNVEKRLGIGSQKVLISVSQLQPREEGGGYFTNLTLTQVKALPKAQ